MTGTLEAPVYPPGEEGGAIHEPIEKPPVARTSRTRATARPPANGSEAELSGAKPSRSRATASGAAGRKPKVNGSVHAQEVEDLSANGSEAEATPPKPSRSRATASGAAGRKPKVNGSVHAAQDVKELSSEGSETAVESPVTESADDEDVQPDPPAKESQEDTKRRFIPSWVAVRSWVRSNLLLSSLAVALVVAVVFLTMTRLSLNNENSLNSARTSAAAAAHSYAVDLASYNYKDLNQDFGKVLGESTPTFKQAFNQSTEALKTSLTRYDASASANVVAVGLLSATTSRAVALVFLNQTVNNTLQKNKPSTTESRVEITLLRSGGRWLIDQVSLL
jgi:Mce-associated membrane protein